MPIKIFHLTKSRSWGDLTNRADNVIMIEEIKYMWFLWEHGKETQTFG
ncbi:MAG: hypothetical protein JXB29_12625 [Sedimentisphaerales bacterium]|nr:hypothetical protein [Sedimentisphaerales bacterium]